VSTRDAAPLRLGNVRLSEHFFVQRGSLSECDIKRFGVFFASHPKIRKVMQKSAEVSFAIASIFLGVKDMLMPEQVDFPARTNLNVSIL